MRLYCLHLLFTLASGLCLNHWQLFGDRCVAVFPVWATWSTAETLCSNSDSHLFSLHSFDDVEFLRKTAAKLGVPIWTGGYSVAQSDSWFWSDGSNFNVDLWTNHTSGKKNNDAACLGSEDAELKSAPCGEMRFYICSRQVRSTENCRTDKLRPLHSDISRWEHHDNNEEAAAPPNLSTEMSLFTVMWSNSESVADEILRSSSFLLQLKSGFVTQSCYDLFSQQEALYMGLVYKTLEAYDIRDTNTEVGSLLLDTKECYKTKYFKQAPVTAPQWLQFALQPFHSVAADDPLYLLVALSARSALNRFVFESLPLPGSMSSSESKSVYQRWKEDSEREVQAAQRFKDVIEKNQNEMDVFTTINIFRQHMMNQKSLHKYVECEE